MNANNPERLPSLGSSPTQHALSATVAQLVGNVEPPVDLGEIVEIANVLQRDLAKGYRQLLKLDEALGGVGLHNVNRREGETLTGAYDITYRPLFRPIQYVYMALAEDNLIWSARRTVQNSCLHVENCVKERFCIQEEDRASLGVLLDRAPVRQNLETRLLELLRTLNRLVYRTAKHSVEHVSPNGHRFTPADGLGVYIVCRWAGVRLLEPTGVFDRWEDASLLSEPEGT